MRFTRSLYTVSERRKMFLTIRKRFYTFIILCYIVISNGEIASNVQLQQMSIDDNYSSSYQEQPHANTSDVVNIKLYYECLCGDCRHFYTVDFTNVVQQLSEYLNIQTYPYGNAKTFNVNGTYKFVCQHGPKECYGNKLHACALNIVKNHTEALLYNSCMMDYSQAGRGSNDIAADKCGQSMKIDSEPIKVCAKGKMGRKLLKDYGDESKKAHFNGVPYVLVNGKESDQNNFRKDVCDAFVNKPLPCVSDVNFK